MNKFFPIIITKLSFRLLFGLLQLHFFYNYIQSIEFNESIISNIIFFEEENFVYLSFATYSNGDMIFSSTAYPQNKKRIFYGFKKNGRPFFKNETSYFYSMISSKQINSEQKFECDSLVIKLSDEKEYLLSTGNKESFCEIYDFEKNEIYKKSMQNFSNNTYYVGSIRNMGIFLLSNGSDNYYLFGFTIKETIEQTTYDDNRGRPTTKNIDKVMYNLQMHEFNTIQNFNSSITVKKEKKIDNIINERDGFSCFITKQQIIMCFYLTKYISYYIIAYNSELEELDRINLNFNKYYIDDDYYYNYYYNSFYRCIHLKEEIGVFYYYKPSDNGIYPILLFKEFSSGKISNYSFSEINFKDVFSTNLLKNDLIKLKEDKICFSSVLYDTTIYIILINLFDNDSKYKVRYYSINLNNIYYDTEIYSGIRTHNYNNFISFAFSYCKIYYDWSIKYSAALMLFSYPNSTDNSSDLYEFLKNNYNSTINDFSVNLENEVRIENNIFGYILDT